VTLLLVRPSSSFLPPSAQEADSLSLDTDFRKRFIQLLSFKFRELETKTALSVIDSASRADPALTRRSTSSSSPLLPLFLAILTHLLLAQRSPPPKSANSSPPSTSSVSNPTPSTAKSTGTPSSTSFPPSLRSTSPSGSRKRSTRRRCRVPCCARWDCRGSRRMRSLCVFLSSFPTLSRR
jgi:hypothetical protein